jgi:threonine synthase
LLPFAPPDKIMTIGEGQTILQRADIVAQYAGINAGCLFLQYEGMNPSGSFKDNGMTAAFTHARITGAKRAACASTGNTSASLAVFCSATGLMRAIIFIGSARSAMASSHRLSITALSPCRSPATSMMPCSACSKSPRSSASISSTASTPSARRAEDDHVRILEAMRWEVPDWIVVPGGNLGNVSSFGKAFIELMDLGLIKRPPRLAVINAAGANTVLSALRKVRPALERRAAEQERDRRLTIRAWRSRSYEPRRLPALSRSIIQSICTRRCVPLTAAAAWCARRAIRKSSTRKRKSGQGDSAANPHQRRVWQERGSCAAKASLPERSRGLRPDGTSTQDPTATVAYHSADRQTFDDVLGHRGVRRATFANRAVQVPNNLDEIIKAIEVYT